MYMDEEFQNDLYVNEYLMFGKDHRRYKYQNLKDYFHLNKEKEIFG
jgi:hypothetical protein